MNIVLIGYRCSGKTSIGKRLADQLGMAFIDTDEKVEGKAGLSIGEIVARWGWGRFRDMERDIVERVSSMDNRVIATGGGVVVDETNIKRLKANGFLVWLDAAAPILKQRMMQDPGSGANRPSLTGTGSINELGAVLDSRIPLYRSASDLVVDSGLLDIHEATAAIAVSLLSRPADGAPFPAGAIGRQGA